MKRVKIDSIEVLQIGSELSGSHCLVQVASDSGVTGLGQSGAWGYPRAVAEVICELRPLLLGADPFRIEHLFNAMTRARPFRGNLVAAAVSAVDNALWDLKGKALEVPVYELLGGRARDKVRLHALIGGASPEALAEAVRTAVREGYSALKFDPLRPGYEDLAMAALVESAVAMAGAAREAAGPGIDMIYELHRKLDPAKALVVANALSRFSPLFIEDPIQIDSIAAQAELCARIEAPTAIGERLSSIWEYRELLSHGVAIHVRPDVGLSGGISHSKKIATLAEAAFCGVIPHNFLGPALTAATLQLCVAIPNLVTLEHSPRADEGEAAAVFSTAVRRRGGYLEVPEVPGIGVELVADHARLAPLLTRPPTWRGLVRGDGGVLSGVL